MSTGGNNSQAMQRHYNLFCLHHNELGTTTKPHYERLLAPWEKNEKQTESKVKMPSDGVSVSYFSVTSLKSLSEQDLKETENMNIRKEKKKCAPFLVFFIPPLFRFFFSLFFSSSVFDLVLKEIALPPIR